jgi:Leucine-rich repeat (LRR) protein
MTASRDKHFQSQTHKKDPSIYEQLDSGSLLLKNIKPGLIPRYIFNINFKDVEKLVLRGNQITEIDSMFCQQMRQIVIFDISQNELVSVSSEISQLRQLKEINLSHNSLEELPKSIFRCQKLEEL